MTTPERDAQRPESQAADSRTPAAPAADAQLSDSQVPGLGQSADAADALGSADRNAPSDAAGKPLYAEQSTAQAAGTSQVTGTAQAPRTGEAAAPTSQKVASPAASASAAAPALHPDADQLAQAEAPRPATSVEQLPKHTEGHTVTYSAATGGVQRVESSAAGRSEAEQPTNDHTPEEGGVLDSLKETLLNRTEGLRQRGSQLAQSARLRMEVMQYGRDLESLYARLGRAYHHHADREILAMIEQEITQVERDIALRERQLDSQDVSHELQVQRVKAARARPDVNLPDPTMPSVAGAIGIEERPPRIQHHLETEKRDTFFGLDKGGVDQQATVSGGNAAFDTQIEPEDSVVSLDDLEEAEQRRRE
ncbi:hypothetical protein [Deinococcus sp. Marseille-Q6407]|uniref:hypothetical protein n=1 Tax=Deinococcus sp. Marseille-Q6407 TaxID=2969223 RepID=UPI0021C09D59|nr:hypothetical protein [Deinococcus sp. Marseille-Q6407]